MKRLSIDIGTFNNLVKTLGAGPSPKRSKGTRTNFLPVKTLLFLRVPV